MADINGIIDQIKELTLLEASQLVKAMEETCGRRRRGGGGGPG
jgi:ribosomal protein L7/L12